MAELGGVLLSSAALVFMNILVVTGRCKLGCDGDSLRMRELFQRLKRTHKIYALVVDAKCRVSSKADLKEFEDLFDAFDVVSNGNGSRGLLGRIRHFVHQEPLFSFRYTNPGFFAKVRQRIRQEVEVKGIDLVHIWHTANAQFMNSDSFSVPVLHDICDSVAFAYKHEHAVNWMKPKRYNEFLRLRNYERGLIDEGTAVFVSERDVELLGRKTDQCWIIPNGVDTDFFEPNGNAPEHDTLLFSGDMSFLPNVEAVLFFHRQVWPLLLAENPQLRWTIAGQKPAAAVKQLHDGRNVFVTGFVEDMREFLAKAQIVICPMVSGLGIKNKVLEAMAMGKPVVTTPVGAAGIRAENGGNVVVAQAPADLASGILRLLRDRDLCGGMGAAARRLIEEEYTWDKTVERYEELYRLLIAR